MLVEKADRPGIFVALGANLDHPTYGGPKRALEAALAELGRRGVTVCRVSPWYRTAPVPASDQPWYVNAVAEITTVLPADRLLALLHEVEDIFGRVRSIPNAARVIDLDLVDYRGQTAPGGANRAILPHPRLQDRAFVLRPLADLVSQWRHPVSGAPIQALLAALPSNQAIERLEAGPLPFQPGRV